MISRRILLGLSLLVTLPDLRVFGCSPTCTKLPVFTPSTLVVKYGDPGSATCAICEDGCNKNVKDLEVSFGNKTISENETTLTWTFDSITEWETSAVCFYTTDEDVQCCTTLPVIVYQPPDVSIEVFGHAGPLLEHEEYDLQCVVRNVAPAQNLAVTFHKGDAELERFRNSGDPGKTPVTEVFLISINSSKEDDGGQYYCRAEVELGHGNPPVIVESEAIVTTVYYGPYLEVSANPDPITLTAGDPLILDCSAEGNPPPSYAWTLPTGGPSSLRGAVLSVSAAGFEHSGDYVCNVTSNGQSDEVKFSVSVRVNIIPYVIAGVTVAVVLLLCATLMTYVHHYKKNHMGRYNLRDVLRFRARPTPMPFEE